jgi:4'-phosphopantetheinyl transferase
MAAGSCGRKKIRTKPQMQWSVPSKNHALAADEVHVWRARLERCEGCLDELNRFLTTEERSRAARFHFAIDRQRSIVGHALARIILAHHLRRSPHELAFDYNPFDKPRLAGGPDPALEFNISHSGEWLLIALAHRVVGVDVERMREDMASAEIAARFFSRAECLALAALPQEMQCSAFFDCWTRKEAYLKARGDGLSLPLDQFDVAFVPGAEPRLLAARHDPAEVRRWALRALDVGPGHKAALAVAGFEWQLKLWDWPGGANFLGGPTCLAGTRGPKSQDRLVEQPV